jgi:PAS domain S-box-containing protein
MSALPPARVPPDFRRAAEAQLAHSPLAAHRPAEQLLHELQVHQIELEMQNEELRRAYVRLDTERARYVDLYDLAPVGYLTVSEKGFVQQANLTACSLLGVARGMLIGQAFSRFVLADDADIFYLLRKKILRNPAPQACELRMLTPAATPVCLHLDVSCARDEHGEPVLRITLSDISARMLAESDLRVAAAAFECQAGFVVLDEHGKMLRVNQAFSQMTGYTQPEVQGKTLNILNSVRHTTAFYDHFWHDHIPPGGLLREIWMRRQTGEDFLAQVTQTVVKNAQGQRTHYVVNFTDITRIHWQEERRLQNEALLRNALVREVHHRIKNNLQGITGLLRQFAQTHPATAEPIAQAISQVQGISVIHGLQGRNNTSTVRLCELTQAIAAEAEILWQTAMAVTMDLAAQTCLVTEKEAVPVALILNELVLNAVKHGGKAQGKVGITLRLGAQPDTVDIHIHNAGQLSALPTPPGLHQSGLKLITALMPPEGARLCRRQEDDLVSTVLTLSPPVIFFKTPGPV